MGHIAAATTANLHLAEQLGVFFKYVYGYIGSFRRQIDRTEKSGRPATDYGYLLFSGSFLHDQKTKNTYIRRMKSSGNCPKCGSREIYTDAGVTAYGQTRLLQVGFWRTATLDRYMCTRCGYVELYLRDKDRNNTGLMDKLRAYWNRR